MSIKRIVVIGGGAAGPKAAARARRLDPNADITLVQKGANFSMAACGYPYYIGGVFDERNALVSTPTGVVRDGAFFMKAKGITALAETEVTAVDRAAHTVTCRALRGGDERALPYDKLVFATGGHALMPRVPGVDLKGVTQLQSLGDADALRALADEGKVKRALIVGGGLIGIEAAEALAAAGMHVTLVEMLPQLLMMLDPQLAKLVENHVKSKGVDVITKNPVAAFLGEGGDVTAVKLANGTELPCELAVVAIGLRPEVALAKASGIEIGELGGVKVDAHMRTSDPDIYAAGDCVETVHRITGRPVLAPFGDLANLQGRVAGQNVVEGDTASFPGTVQTGICKVFDFTAGVTGLSERAAREAGFNPVAALCAGPDKPMFMGPGLVILKLIADADTGRVLGVQGVGPGDVSRRIATAAVAVQAGWTVDDLANADLPYAPPYSNAIDALIAAAHVLQNKIAGRMEGLSAAEVKAKLDAGEAPFLLDVRGPDEFEAMRLGIGETLIPLGALRARTADLPADRSTEIITFCKISLRGWEAACCLKGLGYTNVKVMEGGVVAWPYPREI